MMVALKVGDAIDRDKMLAKFVDIQYKRNDISFERSHVFEFVATVLKYGRPTKSLLIGLNFGGDDIEQISINQSTHGRVDNA